MHIYYDHKSITTQALLNFLNKINNINTSYFFPVQPPTLLE